MLGNPIHVFALGRAIDDPLALRANGRARLTTHATRKRHGNKPDKPLLIPTVYLSVCLSVCCLIVCPCPEHNIKQMRYFPTRKKRFPPPSPWTYASPFFLFSFFSLFIFFPGCSKHPEIHWNSSRGFYQMVRGSRAWAFRPSLPRSNTWACSPRSLPLKRGPGASWLLRPLCWLSTTCCTPLSSARVWPSVAHRLTACCGFQSRLVVSLRGRSCFRPQIH